MRKQSEITTFERNFIKTVNDTLASKGLKVNDIPRLLKSKNYGVFKRFFNESKGKRTSRTYGRICEVLEIEPVYLRTDDLKEK